MNIETEPAWREYAAANPVAATVGSVCTLYVGFGAITWAMHALGIVGEAPGPVAKGLWALSFGCLMPYNAPCAAGGEASAPVEPPADA